MATRATYQFHRKNGDRPNTQYTVYNHWDGYPEGAKSHFEAALKVGDGLTVESFLRRNDQARLTESHEIHGDTEWKYDIWEGRETIIEVSGRLGSWDSPEWEIMFRDSIEEFFKVLEIPQGTYFMDVEERLKSFKAAEA